MARGTNVPRPSTPKPPAPDPAVYVCDLEQDVTKNVQRHLLFDPEGNPLGWYSAVGYVIDTLVTLGAKIVVFNAQAYSFRVSVNEVRELEPEE